MKHWMLIVIYMVEKRIQFFNSIKNLEINNPIEYNQHLQYIEAYADFFRLRSRVKDDSEFCRLLHLS